MEVKITVNKNTLIAAPAEEIDHHSAAAVRKQIDDAYEESRCTDIVFDMNRVEFMDSSGIGVILGRYNRASEKGGRVYITGESEYMRKILDMAGIFKIIQRVEGVI